MELFFYIGVTLSLFFIIALLLAPIVLKPSPVEARLLETVQNASDRRDERRVSAKERAGQTLIGLTKPFNKLVGLADDGLKDRLASAGIRGKNSADLYTSARLLSPLAGLLAGSFIPVNTLFCALLGGCAGYLAPDLWLRSRMKRRRARICKSVPDAVDLLVICMDAGLGLDQAILRVGQELALSHPDIYQEFMQLNFEQRAGKPRMEAWQAMAERTKLEDIDSFVNMLVQTDRFGSPILTALKRLSNDIRLKRRQHAEEMAAKLKIKILFPLVLFIFPCIFIVLLAPALISMVKTLGEMAH
jgi:tight adherence protein C